METHEVLTDAFERTREGVHRVTDGLDADALSYRPDADANTIAWLVWHLTRVQDDHVSEIADEEQAWTSEGWAERFDLPLDVTDTGYGHTAEQVAAVRVEDPELLTGYHDAVVARTTSYLESVYPDELDRIIDERWDPPVSVGVRLVSVINDQAQHNGQAAYVRGMHDRLRT